MTLDEIKKWYINNNKIYFASIELTQNCNFNCKHCYCASKHSKNLDLESYKLIIDKIYSTGCLFLNLTGGEIFTHKNFIDIYCYAKEKGFIIDLLTNISLLSEEHIRLFLKYPPNNIAITIYGTNQDEYERFTGDKNNYYRVINALNLLKKNNIHFVLRTVASKTYYSSLKNGNFEKIANFFDTSFKYEPIIFPQTTGNISPLKECLSPKEIISLESCSAQRVIAWKKEINKEGDFSWSCNAGYNSLSVDYKGDAYICGLYRKNPISILTNKIEDVLLYLKEIHCRHLEIVKSNECSICENRKICKWCPAYSQIYNGNDFSKIPFFCELTQERIDSFGK